MESELPGISPVMAEFSEYIAGALSRPLPPEIEEIAKVHIVDAFAAMLSGSRLPPGQRAIAYAALGGGQEDSTVFGTNLVTTASSAALANGMSAHADETDDVHTATTTHPGAAVVPAAFAIGERNAASGSSVLRAVTLGYDVCGRHGRAMDLKEMHRSGIAINNHSQTFGATAAVAALLQLSPAEVRFALSYAAEQASGIPPFTRDTEHVQKAFGSGRAAQNGVAAGLMVASKFTGIDDVFSGASNYFAVYAPKADLTKLITGLGRDFEIAETSIKTWPTGGPTQAPLSALRGMLLRHELTAEMIERVVVRLAPLDAGIVDGSIMPNIGLQHLVALMLVDGDVTFHSAHDYSRLDDPRVLDMRRRVELVKSEHMADAVRRWRCEVDLRLNDGRTLSEEILAVKGSVQNPMDRASESEKARELIAPILGDARTAELLETLWTLDLINDVRVIRSLTTI